MKPNLTRAIYRRNQSFSAPQRFHHITQHREFPCIPHREKSMKPDTKRCHELFRRVRLRKIDVHTLLVKAYHSKGRRTRKDPHGRYPFVVHLPLFTCIPVCTCIRVSSRVRARACVRLCKHEPLAYSPASLS